MDSSYANASFYKEERNISEAQGNPYKYAYMINCYLNVDLFTTLESTRNL